MPVLPRNIPAFDQVRIAGEPLPTTFAQVLAQGWSYFYDLRDYMLNLFVDDELPQGPINSSNHSFVLSNAPQPPQSLKLFRNGGLLIFGVDYVLTGNSIVTNFAPNTGDTLVAYYRKRGGAPLSALSFPSGTGNATGFGGGANLWTLSPGTSGGGTLFPTTLTNLVLGGLTSTDFPAGTGSIISNKLVGVFTAATNATLIYLSASGGVEVSLNSNISGTGTLLPLSVIIANQRVMRFQISPIAALVGIPTSDAVVGGSIISSSAFIIASASTNASIFEMGQAIGVSNQLISTITGTGTQLPMTFVIGASEAARFNLSRGLLVGLTSSDSGPISGWVIASALVGIVSTTTNASFLVMNFNGTTETLIHSGNTGTGTSLPMSFYTAGVRRVTIDTAGNLFVGALSISLPTAFFVGAGQNIWATDSIGVSTAATNASTLFMTTSPSEVALASHITGTGTNIPLSFYTGGGRRVSIDNSGTLLVGLGPTTVIPSVGRIVSILDVIVITGATANESFGRIYMPGADFRVESGTIGTGTILPMTFYVGGSERARMATTGAFLVGGTSSDAFNSAGEIASIGANSAVGAASATSNASFIYLFCGGSPSVVTISSGHSGTGTTQPIAINSFGVEQARWDTGGTYMVGFAGGGDYANVAGRILASRDLIFATASTNSSFIRMVNFSTDVNGATLLGIQSSATGTGTTQALGFAIGTTEVARFATAQSFLVGLASTDSGINRKGDIYISDIFGVLSATTNAHALFLSINGTTETVIHSSFTGAGSSLPLSLYVNAIRGMTLTVANPVHVLIGTNVDDGTGALLQVHGNISVNGTVLTVP